MVQVTKMDNLPQNGLYSLHLIFLVTYELAK